MIVRKRHADTTHSTSLDSAGKVGNRNESDNKEGEKEVEVIADTLWVQSSI